MRRNVGVNPLNIVIFRFHCGNITGIVLCSNVTLQSAGDFVNDRPKERGGRAGAYEYP